MSYKNTILSRPGEKYPFLLATEADGIPLTRAELETLKFEIECALMDDDGFCGDYTDYTMRQGEMGNPDRSM